MFVNPRHFRGSFRGWRGEGVRGGELKFPPPSLKLVTIILETVNVVHKNLLVPQTP